MNHKEYEEKRRALFYYQHLVRRLDQKCREAGKWTSMAVGAGSGLLTLGSNRGQGSITVAAAALQQEVEELAEQVMEQREMMLAAIENLDDEIQQEIMEARYVAGMSIQQIGDTYGYTVRHVNRLLEMGTSAIIWPPEGDAPIKRCPKMSRNVPECPIETTTVIDV